MEQMPFINSFKDDGQPCKKKSKPDNNNNNNNKTHQEYVPMATKESTTLLLFNSNSSSNNHDITNAKTKTDSLVECNSRTVAIQDKAKSNRDRLRIAPNSEEMQIINDGDRENGSSKGEETILTKGSSNSFKEIISNGDREIIHFNAVQIGRNSSNNNNVVHPSKMLVVKTLLDLLS